VAIYDQINKRMTIYGGNDSASVFNDTWVLSNADTTTGSPTWTLIKAKGAAKRTAAAAIYNPGTNQMTVFAGNSVNFGAGVTSSVLVLSKANGLP